MIRVLPSVLAADPLAIGRDVERMLQAGATELHLDVMDAHFVPNLAFGPAVCAALKCRFQDIPLDVHLMMTNPMDYAETFARAGAAAITLHWEAVPRAEEALARLHALGLRAGLALKPATPAERIMPLLPLCDQVLVMTVEPGFGGQQWMGEMMPKIQCLRKAGYGGCVMVDGGVNADTAPRCVAAGADALVMGTALMRSPHPEQLLAACARLGDEYGQ